MFPKHYNSCQNDGRTEMQYSSISSGFTNLVCNKDANSEVNLIDLLDNTHISNSSHATDNDKEKQISDLQIKMLEEFCTTSKLPKQTEFQDAEFHSFLDKYEFSKVTETPDNKLKYEDILESEQKTIAERRSDSACALNLIETPKVLVPRLEEAFKPEPAARELNINEDLIEEVMFEQQLEKQLQATNKTYQLRSNFDKEPISNQTSTMPKTSIHSKSFDDHNIFDEIISKNKVSYFGKPTQNNPETNATKFLNANSENINYASQSQMNLDQKEFINELVTKYDIKYLEAMKKVDKVFLKRSVLKSAVEKSMLTLGPTLYEKAVFLPQLMQCLSEKQKALDSKTTMKMRLILDTSSSCSKPIENSTQSTNPPKSLNTSISAELNLNNVMVLTPPQVLLADCNKERLKALETAKRFNNFVCNGTFPLHK